MATNAGGKVEQAGDSASLEVLALVGLIAYGVLHLLVGWLALQPACVTRHDQGLHTRLRWSACKTDGSIPQVRTGD
jgi:hypothetical protein